MAKSRRNKNNRVRNIQSRGQRQPQPAAANTARTAVSSIDTAQATQLVNPPLPVAPQPMPAEPVHRGDMSVHPSLSLPLEFLPLANNQEPSSPPMADEETAAPLRPSGASAPTESEAAALQDVENTLPLEFGVMEFVNLLPQETETQIYAPQSVWVDKGDSLDLAFYSTGRFSSRTHWLKINGRSTKYACHGPDCHLCLISGVSEEYTFPVFDPEDQLMKIYAISNGKTPKAQLPQLMHVLEHAEAFPVLIRIEHKADKDVYEINARPWPARIHTGVAAYQEFLLEYSQRPFSLNPGAREWCWNDLLKIEQIRRKAILRGIPTS